jgi:transposase-like protein
VQERFAGLSGEGGHGKRLIVQISPLPKETHAMTTRKKATASLRLVEQVLTDRPDQLKALVKAALEEVLQAEMTDTVGAQPGQRVDGRLGYRAGYYVRGLVTRIGKLELRVPRDRDGRFSTELFERYQRSEKALVSSLAEMYVQGVSTRKVKTITEELCGHSFSAATVSQINKGLDATLRRFAERTLEDPYPYLVLDARYEKVRLDGVIRSQAVLIAIGINWEGRRNVLGVELAQRESASSWKDFLAGLKARGLTGVELVIADDHAGLRRALVELLPEAAYQRCYVHFLRNALDYLPRKADDDCLQELRWIYDRRNLAEAQADLAAWLKRWEKRYPKLTDWAEAHIAETLTFYRLPRQHHRHLKSTNLLERLNEEIRRRTYVVRIFPNEASCLRLVRALCAEVHENWIEDHRYLDMSLLKEQKKERLRAAA